MFFSSGETCSQNDQVLILLKKTVSYLSLDCFEKEDGGVISYILTPKPVVITYESYKVVEGIFMSIKFDVCSSFL